MQAYLPKKYDRPHYLWSLAVIASLALHVLSSQGLNYFAPFSEPMKLGPVKLRVAESERKEPEALPPKPRKKEPRPKPAPPPNSTPAPKTATNVAPIQGLAKDSLSTSGSMAAPIGNTLMTEDTGQRVKDAQALKGDQSAPAKLIASTLSTPPYSDEALDAGLEGSFIVDVFVSLDGQVREAELQKKIGYGMDERVLKSVRTSKFEPRRNRLGLVEGGWTVLKFTLVIP